MGLGSHLQILWAFLIKSWILPRWAGKESACNVGNLGLIPGLGRPPGEGKGYPLQYSGLENSMDCIVHGVPKSGTLLTNFHFLGRFCLNTYKLSYVDLLIWKIEDNFLFLVRIYYQNPVYQGNTYWFFFLLLYMASVLVSIFFPLPASYLPALVCFYGPSPALMCLSRIGQELNLLKPLLFKRSWEFSLDTP